MMFTHQSGNDSLAQELNKFVGLHHEIISDNMFDLDARLFFFTTAQQHGDCFLLLFYLIVFLIVELCV